MSVRTRPVAARDRETWIRFRHALYGDEEAVHREEAAHFLAGTAREPRAVLVAEEEDRLLGFVELSIRPHAEGCVSTEVAYLEGWYVAPGERRRGVGRALVEAAGEWARGQGCTEFASDSLLDNEASARAHRSCGFEEVGQARCYRKELAPAAANPPAVAPPVPRLAPIDYTEPAYARYFDELPLWSAPFGLWLLERVPLRAGLAVMDVGAGTGYLSLEIAQRCGPDAVVYAVDPWEAAMQRLREKVRFLGIPNVRLLVTDASRVDLPDASIDLFVSNLGINNFEDPPAVLAECFRVGKPGADLLLTTNLTGHMQEFYDAFRATLEETGLAARIPALEAHIAHRGTVDSVRDLLDTAGFPVQDVHTRSRIMRFANGTALLRHHLIRVGFLPAWMEAVPEEERDRVFADLEARLDSRAAARGELALTIPMACFEARRRER